MGWTKPVEIEGNKGYSPTLVSWGADVHLVHVSGTGRLWASVYRKKTGTWDPNYMINDTKKNSHPNLSLFHGMHLVHIDWRDQVWLTKKRGMRWTPNLIPNTSITSSNGFVAIIGFEKKCHMVYVANKKTLMHSIYDGEKWGESVEITGKFSKYGPGLIVFKDKIHMVYPRQESDYKFHTLYLSTYDGEKWGESVEITGKKSDAPPALGVLNGKIHMVYHSNTFQSTNLFHSIYDGEKWSDKEKIPDHDTLEPPALAWEDWIDKRLYMVHTGKSGMKLYYSSYSE